MKISIVGITGYSGIELIRLLHQHPTVEIVGVYADSSAGIELANYYPHLKNIYYMEIKQIDAAEIMATSDCVFFATPSGISAKLAHPFIAAKFPIIDLSGDYRLPGEKYEQWYAKPAADATDLATMQYVLADLDDKPANQQIANPGCYATATLLALAPLVKHGLVDNSSMIVDAKSGLSGAGKKLSETSHYSFIHDNMLMYKANEHQHIPEIVQKLQIWEPSIQSLHFQTSLIPVTRGIFVTAFAKVQPGVTEEQLYAAYQQVYANSQFVRVQPQGQLPNLKQVIGSNYCDLGLTLNETTGIVTVVSVIDNLIKGAAGQAIQNMNKIFDLPENAGLDFVPQFP
ncbi:MAG: N-acetyl-gamma-glutamyl-phosphate reductase [Lactobacillaceae bacterium]|jgi:N-acetyl-gamma-glutamyl-phosphate reductase|nr:N-acetyl-gamma-glutamyl-phosphate reductase [Lactobacillaceae bacterium]